MARITEKSTKRGKHVEGIKHDSEKIRLDLLSTLAVEEMCKVLTYGVSKYGDDNWRLGMHWRRLLRAATGHIWSFMRGEDLDPETGYCHLAHAMCCLMFLLEYWLTGNGVDNRWNERNKMSHDAGSGGTNRGVRAKKSKSRSTGKTRKKKQNNARKKFRKAA
jgi:hypothetical protein